MHRVVRQTFSQAALSDSSRHISDIRIKQHAHNDESNRFLFEVLTNMRQLLSVSCRRARQVPTELPTFLLTQSQHFTGRNCPRRQNQVPIWWKQKQCKSANNHPLLGLQDWLESRKGEFMRLLAAKFNEMAEKPAWIVRLRSKFYIIKIRQRLFED